MKFEVGDKVRFMDIFKAEWNTTVHSIPDKIKEATMTIKSINSGCYSIMEHPSGMYTGKFWIKVEAYTLTEELFTL
jgi:hypothetical protein